MTDPDDIKFEFFKVEPPVIEITRNDSKLVEFSGKIEAGGMTQKLVIELTKKSDGTETLTPGLTGNGYFKMPHPANVNNVGEYTAIAIFAPETSFEKKSDQITLEIKLK